LQKYKAQYNSPSVSEFISALIQSGHLYNSPTTQKGYGIPNFLTAFSKLPTTETTDISQSVAFIIGYNPSNKSISIKTDKIDMNATVRIYSVTGALVYSNNLSQQETILSCNAFAKGIYALRVIANGQNFSQKIIIY